MSKDNVYDIFGNLPDLLDFQRRFLIALEGTLSMGPNEQRVGSVFISHVAHYNCRSLGFPFMNKYVQTTP